MMISLKLIPLIVPGYSKLSNKQQFDFAVKLSGIESVANSFKKLNPSKNDTQLLNCIREHIKLKCQDIYKEITNAIAQTILTQISATFRKLSSEQQNIVCQHQKSQELVSLLISSDDEDQTWYKVAVKLVSGQSTLETNKTKLAIDNWHKVMFEHDEFSFSKTLQAQNEFVLRQRDLQRNRGHVRDLTKYFPLIAYRFPGKSTSYAEQLLYDLNASHIALQSNQDFNAVKHFFIDLFEALIDDANNPEDLHDFFKRLAEEFSQKVMQGYPNKDRLEWGILLDRLMDVLADVKGKMLCDDANARQSKKPFSLMDSLSFLWKNPLVVDARVFLDKIADAHGFIHATGFAMHAENPFFSVLDLYNYARYKDIIIEARSVLLSLLEPLLPLYFEYKFVAFHDKNSFMRCFRIIMPIFIITLLPSVLSLLIAPLALPEIALTLLYIPAICLGFAAANYYVLKKNDIYNKFRTWYYGSQFEIPEYQINQRMISAFNGEENAQLVRRFYIEQLQGLMEQLEALHHKEITGTMSDADIALKGQINNKQRQLLLDWYDIHSNNKLSSEHARAVLSSRLQEEGKIIYQKLSDAFELEKPHIQQTLFAVKKEIERIFDQFKVPEEYLEDVDRSLNQSPTEERKVRNEEPPNSVTSSENTTSKHVTHEIICNSRFSLFHSSSCIIAKQQLERIKKLKTSISEVPASQLL